jgi:hypothetical protein
MASQLDGAGQMKMVTLDEALIHLQRVHAIVERYGIAVRNQQETGSFRMQITRAATPLVGMLKSNFGQIADLVSALILASTRGGGEQAKLRALREYVAQVRTQLEIATTKVKEKHGLSDQSPAPPR